MAHQHTSEEMKPIVNRLSRAIGHLEHVKKMVEEGRNCSEILIQLSAVEAAINSTGVELLKDHIDHCVLEAVNEGDMKAIEDLKIAIERYWK
ncbi:MAG: metal-sensing transcriptional repressor [Lachnospiraceae bacterium]|nr:metal-sensing transcriptional repressor [Lachnospiraceae bacterium]